MRQSVSASTPLSRFINLLVLALVFFIPISISFVLVIIKAKTGRLSQAASNIAGKLVMTPSQPLHVSVFDFLNFALLMLLIIFFINNKQLFLRYLKKLSSNIIWVIAFIAWGGTSLLANFHAYTHTQWLVCLLYLLKFSSVLLVYFYVMFYFSFGGVFSRLVKTVLLSVFIAAILGVASWYHPSFNTVIIRDRESYFGVLSLLVLFIFNALEWQCQGKYQLSKPWIWFAFVNLVLATFMIINCEKRGVVLAFLLACTFLFLLLRKLRLYFLFVFIGIILAAPQLNHMYHSIFANDNKIYSWEGISPRFSERLRASELSRLLPVDTSYSVTARVARSLESMHLIRNAPIMGVGFWGVQYIYNFLPDTMYFQVLVEMGVVGAGILLIFLFLIMFKSIKLVFRKNFIGYVVLSFLSFFLIAGASANTLYISNVIAICWLFIALLDTYYYQLQEG